MIIFYLLQEAKQKQRRMSAGALQELFFLPCAPEDPCAVQRGRHVVLPWSSCSSPFRRADSPALFSRVIVVFSNTPGSHDRGLPSAKFLSSVFQPCQVALSRWQSQAIPLCSLTPAPVQHFQTQPTIKKSLPKVVWSMNFGCPSDMHNPWVNIRPAPFHGLWFPQIIGQHFLRAQPGAVCQCALPKLCSRNKISGFPWSHSSWSSGIAV